MRFVATLILLTLAACGEAPPETLPGRWYTAAQVAEGAGLYQLYCAACHAPDGSATADWRTPGADGHYPPPPLDGTAHTWHHPLDVLSETIAAGGAEFGGVMPGFSGSLDEPDRLAVIAWVQSLWPDDIYQRWYEIEQRSR